jgi:hypothetical protein
MKKKRWVLAALIVLAGIGAGTLFSGRLASDAVAVDQAKDVAGDVEAPVDQGKGWQAPDQVAAQKRAREMVPFVDTVIDECLLCRQQKLRDKGYSTKDIPHKYVLLDSPIIKKQEDRYGPVRFMHSKHASLVQDCALCHHYRPTDPEALETTRCSACHQDSFRSDHPDRIGLKAAYHMNCIECHKQMNDGPVDCTGCHLKKVPEHKDLVAKLSATPEPTEVTVECLSCHKNAGEDMLTSVHWLWKGHSPYTMDHRKEVQHGKATTALNNF